MSRIQMPTREEVLQLAGVRSDVCVSVYMETSPARMFSEECRSELGRLLGEAYCSIEANGLSVHRLEALRDELDAVTGEEDFCRYQSNSLVILATPDMVRVYRLPTHLSTQLEVSDRFYLQPLLRALTFPHTAYVLALSDNGTRLIELCPDAAPERMIFPDLPRDPMSALGLRRGAGAGGSRSGDPPHPGTCSKERKRSLAVYCRLVDEALKPLVRQSDSPVVLAAAEPLASIFRSVATVCMTEGTIKIEQEMQARAGRTDYAGNSGVAGQFSLAENFGQTGMAGWWEGADGVDSLTDHDLARLAEPVLDRHYAQLLEGVKERFERHAGQNRVSTDIAAVARAATYGMVSLALVDFGQAMPGLIDEDGEVLFTNEPGAYGVLDEIVRRALESGAKVLSVRPEDMIGNSGVAAVLRYPLEPVVAASRRVQ
ncbi:hypothetical protein LJC48_06460 [Desulfovibrio sp. OttesenSCG-928-C06]|nr:hypothetical protein [Desulfovibrio sp. OttesenSCG-928-C06]